MKIRYDKQADALVIRFSDAPILESDEVQEGLIVDYDRKKKIVGFELLDASRQVSPKDLEALERPIMAGAGR
jgi:uncharacterized protein YuzE